MYTESQDDYLDMDPEIPTQKYALMSFLTPLTVKTDSKYDWTKYAFKVRGLFSSIKASENRRKYLFSENSYHHIFDVQVGGWIGWDHNAKTWEEAISTDKVNDLMRMKKEQDARVKDHDSERQHIALKNAEKQRKMMKKRNKKLDSMVEKEVGQNLVETNITHMQDMTQEELQKKIEKLNISKTDKDESTPTPNINTDVDSSLEIPDNIKVNNDDEADEAPDDDQVIPSQQWVLVSVVNSDSVKEAKDMGWNVTALKIRGAFETEEEAQSRKEYLESIDEHHVIFGGVIGRWINWNDDPNDAEEVIYAEPKLQQLMNMNKIQSSKIKEHEIERKTVARSNAIRQKKLLERQKQQELANPVKTTEEIVGHEIVEENLTKLQQLSNEDIMKKIIAMKNPPIVSNDNVNVNVSNDNDNDSVAMVKQHIEENKKEIAEQENTIDKIEQEYQRVQQKLLELKNKK